MGMGMGMESIIQLLICPPSVLWGYIMVTNRWLSAILQWTNENVNEKMKKKKTGSCWWEKVSRSSNRLSVSLLALTRLPTFASCCCWLSSVERKRKWSVFCTDGFVLICLSLSPVQVLVPRVIGMYFLVGLAFFFYITRIPERFFNGKVDYLGHSHNLWHIIIVLALYHWHNTGERPFWICNLKINYCTWFDNVLFVCYLLNQWCAALWVICSKTEYRVRFYVWVVCTNYFLRVWAPCTEWE